MRLLTALAVLLLFATPLSAQTPDQAPSRLDTVTVYGMQFRVVAMSTTRSGGARPGEVRSYRASTLESEGYTQLGGFYINAWRDPVTLDSMKRAIAIAESPESVGMENTNVVGGAVLVAGCDGDDAAVQIRPRNPWLAILTVRLPQSTALRVQDQSKMPRTGTSGPEISGQASTMMRLEDSSSISANQTRYTFD